MNNSILNDYLMNNNILDNSDELMVPVKDKGYFNYYKVTNGDTLYKIASDNKINPQLLASLNGINMDDYIYPNQVLLIPKANSILYITTNGDTIGGIIKGLNISVDELMKQNENLYLQPEQLIVYNKNND